MNIDPEVDRRVADETTDADMAATEARARRGKVAEVLSEEAAGASWEAMPEARKVRIYDDAGTLAEAMGVSRRVLLNALWGYFSGTSCFGGVTAKMAVALRAADEGAGV